MLSSIGLECLDQFGSCGEVFLQRVAAEELPSLRRAEGA